MASCVGTVTFRVTSLHVAQYEPGVSVQLVNLSCGYADVVIIALVGGVEREARSSGVN